MKIIAVIAILLCIIFGNVGLRHGVISHDAYFISNDAYFISISIMVSALFIMSGMEDKKK